MDASEGKPCDADDYSGMRKIDFIPLIRIAKVFEAGGPPPEITGISIASYELDG
jgi:hypothetical protein